MTSLDTTLLAEMFKMLGDPSRLRILLTIMDAPIHVGDIAQRTGLSPSLVSHHLRLLRAARFVKAERHGRHMAYQLHDHHITSILQDMASHLGEEDHL
ncbi:MAG: ArsR family transcriptional regulator [Parvibaculaceae bacterium]|jgi:ArsR family transcriptional regulator|nr:metalloregulator ArsR/SmtB family transcription factor [Parvibaculaceae bacterium]|tara:strand:+ start:180 stop:473 length:294 start_codon:yes stop_codon:yes gene_type:complete